MASRDLEQALTSLDAMEARRYALRYALVSAEWLAETADPEKAAPGRGEAVAGLEEMDREVLCGAEMGAALDVLDAHREELGFKDAARLRVLGRDRSEQTRIPNELAGAMSRAVNDATMAWRRAKRDNDWGVFAPHLDAVVALCRRQAACLDPGRDPYDVLLDLYEPGCDQAFYDRFFERVRACVVPLVERVAAAPQLSRSCVTGAFDPERQWALARDLALFEGVDPEKLVMGRTEHPFSDGIDSGHVFIATHIYEDDVLSNVFSVLHEGGHAMYEAGVDPEFDRTCLAGGTSMGMHEAQSRFFENYVGRSRAFAGPLLAAVASHFPEKLAGVTAEDLYRAENRVEPSLVRTEADELTYPLHVMVRYEVEKGLLSGKLAAADVPAAWGRLYREYLGVEVPNDRRGALQDIHWSQASIGYFPTYALGGAYGAQLLHAMTTDLEAAGRGFDEVLASGDLAPVRAWLGDRVWRWGRSKEPRPIVEEACGEPFDPGYYCDYLERKFGELYGL